MRTKVIYSLLALLCFTTKYSQNLWNSVSDRKVQRLNKTDRASMPSEYKLYSLDFTNLNRC